MQTDTKAWIVGAGGWALLVLAVWLELLSYLAHDRSASLAILRAALAVAMAVQWRRDRERHGGAVIDPWYVGGLAALTLAG